MQGQHFVQKAAAGTNKAICSVSPLELGNIITAGFNDLLPFPSSPISNSLETIVVYQHSARREPIVVFEQTH